MQPKRRPPLWSLIAPLVAVVRGARGANRSDALLFRPMVAALTVAAAAFDLGLARNHFLGVSGDDAVYLTLAEALARGRGFVDLALPSTPPETSVPPGFPALLAPVVAIASPHSPALQVIPLVAAVLAVPLTVAYLRGFGIPDAATLVGGALVAFNPGFGLYATIVMPETSFVCVLLILLLLLRRWARSSLLSAWGVGALVAAVALFELKLAAVLLLGPLVAALLLTGRRAHALALAVATSAAALPLLVVRLASGVSPAGATYDANFTDAYGGLHGIGLVVAAAQNVAGNLAALVYPTLAETLIGIGPAPLAGGKSALIAAGIRDGLIAALALAILAGASLLWRRTHDIGLLAVWGYLLLVTGYPIMNTRRTILVLPVLVACLLVGLTMLWRLIRDRASATRLTRSQLRAAVAIVMAGAVVLPLAADDLHHLRDYRSDWTVNLLPDRPWLRYLAQHGRTDSLVEVIYPRQVYLAIGMHADSSLWPACAVVFNQGSRRAFDAVLTSTRPSFVVSSGTSGDCVPDLIQGDPQYRQVLQDPADRVIIWQRAQTAGTTR